MHCAKLGCPDSGPSLRPRDHSRAKNYRRFPPDFRFNQFRTILMLPGLIHPVCETQGEVCVKKRHILFFPSTFFRRRFSSFLSTASFVIYWRCETYASYRCTFAAGSGRVRALPRVEEYLHLWKRERSSSRCSLRHR